MNINEYQKLLSIEDITELDSKDALDKIGMLVDLAFDYSDLDGLEKALLWTSRVKEKELTASQSALLNYFEANCWANLQTLKRKGKEDIWDWEQEEFEQQIKCLRLAINSSDAGQLSLHRLCQIYTNLANVFDTVGRFSEAIHYWNKALQLKNDFAITIGNYGLGLVHYAETLYDEGHICIMLRTAYDKLRQAVDGQLEEGTLALFKEYIKKIGNLLGSECLDSDCLTKKLILEDYSMGDTPEEKRYRQWCLNEKLFLNPLNDLGPYSIASRDVLTCPSIVMPIEDSPYYHAFFNSLKQEYVSARWLAYEGIFLPSPHFSDKHVLLYDTLDYPCYGLSVQKTCIAFRMAYSLFDKIALFLNYYLNLKIDERKVNFRTLWYKNQKQKEGLRPGFQRRENWPLRGLFWLSKDLYYDDESFREALEPESKDLKRIRDHLEHRYLKLHDNLWPKPAEKGGKFLKLFEDKLAYSLHRKDFERKTIKIIKLARAALIYLALGIHIEEKRKNAGHSKEELVPPIFLEIWEDDWKY